MKYLKIFVLISLLLFSASASAEFYKYTDEDGNIRFTDDINLVPEEQRSKIRSYVESESEEPPVQENQEQSTQQSNFPELSEDEPEQGSIDELKDRIESIKEELEQDYAALLKEKEQLDQAKKR